MMFGNNNKKFDIIDTFTSIDELLEVIALLQQQTYKQQELTNKLLYLLIQSIGQGQPVQVDLGNTSNLLSISDEYKTFIFQRVNFSGDAVVFEKQASGIISELSFLSDVSDSDNADFSIKIVSDNDVLVDKTYTELAGKNNYRTDITAYNDSSYYALIFKDIAFSSNIVIQIYNSSATFDEIYLKYHERL